MTPELARLLTDHGAKQGGAGEEEIYVKKVEALISHWYSSFGEGVFGAEHNLNQPIDAYQLFMAKAWIQNASGEELKDYIDIPWLTEGGDLFYLQKLAETIKAYRGWCWSIDGTNCDDGSVPSITGDLNNDNTVNIQDIIILINEIFTPSGVQGLDINSDGKVDILDVISLINIIFK